MKNIKEHKSNRASKQDLAADDILARPGFEQWSRERAQELVETLKTICENVFEIFQRECKAVNTPCKVVDLHPEPEEETLKKAA